MYIIASIIALILMASAGYGDAPIASTPLSPPVIRGERTVTAVRTTAPKIDGVFDAEWLKAEPADHFIQRKPVEGAAESLPTRVYLLYDDDALNVCFVCNDKLDSLSARVLRRDNSTNCDVVGVFLDSFRDHRNCYYFGVTAAGGQVDGVMTNESNSYDTWDGVWESAVGRNDTAWIAEMRIPFSGFRHGGARADGWGTNFERWIDRRQEDVFWQPVNNQRGVHVGEFGTLAGLEQIGSSKHLEMRPHVVGRWDAPQNAKWASHNEWQNIGAYLKYVPTSNWAADLAYQPDFAQVDVDEEVINTSDYPVFLTEKRPFFLEVGNFFDTSPIQLLYTRRITDPDFGGRVYGQSEKFRGMVLGGQNRTADGRGQAVGAGRAQWNVGKQSSIGFTGVGLYEDSPRENPLRDIGIGGSTYGDNFYSASGGLDARIRWGSENTWTITGAGVLRSPANTVWQDQEVHGSEHAVRPFEFRNDLYLNLHPLPLKFSLNDHYRGQDYNINDLGWGDYSNAFENFLWVGNVWQPGKAWMQQWGLDLNGWQRTLSDGRYPEGGGNANLWIQTKSNYQIGGGTDWGKNNRRRYTGSVTAGEFRDNFFEYLGRFDMEPHPYHTQWGWFETDDRRWLAYYVEGNFGTFREGQKQIWNQKLTLKPRANLETSLAMDWTRIWGVGDINNYANTNGRILRWQTRYSPTLNLSLRGTLQWIDKGDPQITGYVSNSLLTNLLLAWNWRPGSWFYVVYDEGRVTPIAYRTEGDRTVRVKLAYFFAVK